MRIHRRHRRTLPLITSALVIASFVLVVALPAHPVWGREAGLADATTGQLAVLRSIAYTAFWLLMLVPLLIQALFVIAALRPNRLAITERGERQFNSRPAAEALWSAVPAVIIFVLGLASYPALKRRGEMIGLEPALLMVWAMILALTLALSFPYYLRALMGGLTPEKLPSVLGDGGIQGAPPASVVLISSDGAEAGGAVGAEDASVAPAKPEAVGHG